MGIDFIADEFANDLIRDRFGKKVTIRGEESSLEGFNGEHSCAVLLDMVDGTDLLQRGFGNWCAAMVFFDVRTEVIQCALIGTPDGTIYYMKSSDPHAYVKTPAPDSDDYTEQPIAIDSVKESEVVRIENAGIAFYGQKAGSLLTLCRQKRFMNKVRTLERLAKKYKGTPNVPQFRIYNLAGNPMMMNLLEGRIDAIVECRGQLCHDVVPGFAIALRAGAHIIDLKEKKALTLEAIGSRLLHPDSKFQYVMASTKALAEELASLLDYTE